jgi:hypothetical protein
VTMVSTAADAWEPGVVVMRREKGRAIWQEVPSTPVHIQYQEFMRGIDVIDQLRTYYSIQLRSKKWWKKLMCFVLDQSFVNLYILYLEDIEKLGLKPLEHARFN